MKINEEEKINYKELLVLKPYFKTLFSSDFFIRPAFENDFEFFIKAFKDTNYIKNLGNWASFSEEDRIKRLIQISKNASLAMHSTQSKYSWIYSFSVINDKGVTSKIAFRKHDKSIYFNNMPAIEISYFASQKGFTFKGLKLILDNLDKIFDESECDDASQNECAGDSQSECAGDSQSECAGDSQSESRRCRQNRARARRDDEVNATAQAKCNDDSQSECDDASQNECAGDSQSECAGESQSQRRRQNECDDVSQSENETRRRSQCDGERQSQNECAGESQSQRRRRSQSEFVIHKKPVKWHSFYTNGEKTFYEEVAVLKTPMFATYHPENIQSKRITQKSGYFTSLEKVFDTEYGPRHLAVSDITQVSPKYLDLGSL